MSMDDGTKQFEDFCRTRDKIRNLQWPSEQTDNSNARDFLDNHSLDLKYVPVWGKWLVWQFNRWVIDIGSAITIERAKHWAKCLYDDLVFILKDDDIGEGAKDSAKSFVKQTNNAPRIRRMLELACCDDRVRTDHTALNSDPYLLNVINGTVDLRTGLKRDHQREDLITQMANVSFDASAKCPQFLNTLSMAFAKDEKLTKYVQVVTGYSLLAMIDEHLLLILHGNGMNGKSTFTNTVMEILGDYGITANESLLMASKHDQHPTEKADLYQRRFVTISEPAQGRRLNEGLVKELTGDRVVKARRMREDFWGFSPTHTFWMATNHRPRIRGTDEGIWRRIKLIPFEVDLRLVTTPKPGFVDTLVRDEGPGILNWMIEGALDYQRNGLESFEPDAVKAATAEYRTDEDEFGRFAAECFEEQHNGVVTAKDAFQKYHSWGGQMNQTLFGKEMKKRFDWDKPSSGPFRKKVIYVGISTVFEKCP